MLGLGLGIWTGVQGEPAGEGGASGPSWSLIPSSGLIGDYRFLEGSGSTIANAANALKPIDLSSTTSQSAVWTTAGVKTTNGMVEIPSLTGVTEIAFLYRVPRNQTGPFLISGYTGGNGDGWYCGDYVRKTDTNLIGQNGVSSLMFEASNGQFAHRLNRGGWKLGIRNTAQFTGKIGLGGQHSAATNRLTEFEVAACWVWNRTLDATERNAVYTVARQVAKSRGFYIDYRDCPTQGDLVVIMGESNPEGRALKAELSGADQALATTNTLILAANANTQRYPPAALALGTNQTTNTPATYFGPEMGLAWARQSASKKLLISKLTMGSTFLAPSSINIGGLNTPTVSWNIAEPKNTGEFWLCLKYYWDAEDYWLNNGIGPKLIAVVWDIGLNDGSDTAYVASSAAQKQRMDDIRSSFQTYCNGGNSVQHIIARSNINAATNNATAIGYVRQAQTDHVAANSGDVLVNTDSFTLNADNVHYNAAAMKSYGATIASAITGWSA